MEYLNNGCGLIAKERVRQIEEEKWSNEHDDENTDGELVLAAVSYALPPNDAVEREVFYPSNWNEFWYKPTPNDRIRELTKAGALIAAEIDRLLRLAEK